MTYESGLSGGAWLLSSISANNWPTISSLKTSLWEQGFQNTLLDPNNFLSSDINIAEDLIDKDEAGFSPTLTDPYGRLLGYQLLSGNDGGVGDTVSGLTGLSGFAGASVPFPIITALGVDTAGGNCIAPANATQYEFTPYEFGSWDSGVAAFTPIKYLGSSLSGGSPTQAGSCITGYDNQGYILGTSSTLFNEVCAQLTGQTGLIGELVSILEKVHTFSERDEYAVYPNPFYNYPGSSAVSSMTELDLVDGGEAAQNNPIWPHLHRAVDVLIVNDNSADTSANFPDGTQLYTTYTQAQAAGLARMPTIPPPATFAQNGWDKAPVFFGCNDTASMTIVYLPNAPFSYNSGQSTAKLQYAAAETDAMIANGVQVGAFGGSKTWATCLGCGILEGQAAREGKQLPAACAACLKQFCYAGQ